MKLKKYFFLVLVFFVVLLISLIIFYFKYPYRYIFVRHNDKLKIIKITKSDRDYLKDPEKDMIIIGERLGREGDKVEFCNFTIKGIKCMRKGKVFLIVNPLSDKDSWDTVIKFE